ncbi:MAG TPA: STAS domain-containing protein [Methylococcaceae bacterium]|nr:STAS domain-containing protein [Methylococcaceae bacterium]
MKKLPMASDAGKRTRNAVAVELLAMENGRFKVEGELTFASVPEMLKISARLFQGQSSIHLDLSGVGRADSAGLALLIGWRAQAGREKRALDFYAIPEQILAMARVNGVESMLAPSATNNQI